MDREAKLRTERERLLQERLGSRKDVDFNVTWRSVVDQLHYDEGDLYEEEKQSSEEDIRPKTRRRDYDEDFLSESEGFISEMEQIHILSRDPHTIERRKSRLNKFVTNVDPEWNRDLYYSTNYSSTSSINEAEKETTPKRKRAKSAKSKRMLQREDIQHNHYGENEGNSPTKPLKQIEEYRPSPIVKNEQVSEDDANLHLLDNHSYNNLLTILASPLPNIPITSKKVQYEEPSHGEQDDVPILKTNEKKKLVQTKIQTPREVKTPRPAPQRVATQSKRAASAPKKSLASTDKDSKSYFQPTELRKLISDVYSKKRSRSEANGVNSRTKSLEKPSSKLQKEKSSSSFSLSSLLDKTAANTITTPRSKRETPKASYRNRTPEHDRYNRPTSSMSASSASSSRRVKFNGDYSASDDNVDDSIDQEQHSNIRANKISLLRNIKPRFLSSRNDIADFASDSEPISEPAKSALNKQRAMERAKQLVYEKRQTQQDYGTRPSSISKVPRSSTKHSKRNEPKSDEIAQFMNNPYGFTGSITDLIVGKKNKSTPALAKSNSAAKLSSRSSKHDSKKYQSKLANEDLFETPMSLKRDAMRRPSPIKASTPSRQRELLEKVDSEELSMFRKLLDESKDSHKIGRRTKLSDEDEPNEQEPDFEIDDDDFFEARRMMHNITLLRSYMGKR